MAEAGLRTQRLILRPPAADDLPWIFEHINTPAVMRHLGGAVRSEQEMAERLDADIAAFASGEYRRWTVLVADDDRRVGRCGLFRVRSEAAPDALRGQSEIGWTFAEREWGKGYASEAARAVLDFAFETLALAEVFSQTSESNTSSTRMMHRLGFRSRAELGYVDPDYPPQDNPTTVWSITAEDWKARG